MPNVSQFNRLKTRSASKVEVFIEGEKVEAYAGESAASVVLRSGMLPSRTTSVSGEGRAPYCMMGVCFECLLEIDGIANVQGCMTPVVDGMEIRRQKGARALVTSVIETKNQKAEICHPTKNSELIEGRVAGEV